jgi:cytochrome c-type biogenesis protein
MHGEMLALAFFGGVLTSASPCALAAVPVALGFVGGHECRPGRSFTLALAFVLGMTGALVVMGLVAARVGMLLGTLPGPWTFAVGVALVLLGLASFLRPANGGGKGLQRLAEWTRDAGAPGALALGAFMGTAMSPCATPALGVALSIAGQGGLAGASMLYGGLLLGCYGLGRGAVALIAGGAPGVVNAVLQSRSRWSSWMPGRRFFGTALIVTGCWWAITSIA